MIELLLPPSRIIGGSLYQENKRVDFTTKQPVIDQKTGKQAVNFSFGIAVAKGNERSWKETTWGTLIAREAESAWSRLASTPTFAWKISDGDSNVPNKSGNVPCENEGYLGNWIIWFNNGWAPPIFESTTRRQLFDADLVVPGDYVEVYAGVRSNNSAQSPGLFMSPLAVGFLGKGERIETKASIVNVNDIPFGQQRVPMGAKPLIVEDDVPFHPSTPLPPANPAFLDVPVPPTLPKMTAKASGLSYVDMIAKGWTDDLMIQHGYMVR